MPGQRALPLWRWNVDLSRYRVGLAVIRNRIRMSVIELPATQNPRMRWRNRQDLSQWVAAFATYFPRKAHLAEVVASQLAGASSYRELVDALPEESAPDKQADREDPVFAQRRMQRFLEDRGVLVWAYRMLPDVADLFLTLCPVGAQTCQVNGVKDAYFDADQCFYDDASEPSDHLDVILGQQRREALGQCLKTVDSTTRLGHYAHPAVLFNLFRMLGWDFSPDMNGCERLNPQVPIARMGWINDEALGQVEAFVLRFTAPPAWGRDEVFLSVLIEVRKTRSSNDQPVLIMNNRPHQLVIDGAAFTSVGWLVIGEKIVPWFVSPACISLSSTVIDLMTFNPSINSEYVDEHNVMLSLVWGLLRETSPTHLPARPAFKSLPDHWMVLPSA